MEKYTLEYMIESFSKHAENNSQKRIEDLEKYPDAEWLKHPFDISLALLSICEEIEKIRSM